MRNERATFFSLNSTDKRKEAQATFTYNFNYALVPYYNRKYHKLALLYPITNMLKCLIGIREVIKDTFSLLSMIFNSNSNRAAISSIARGIGQEILAVIINTLNIAMSLISLAARSIATLFSLGYTQSNRENVALDRRINERNTALNIVRGVLSDIVEYVDDVIEDANEKFIATLNMDCQVN